MIRARIGALAELLLGKHEPDLVRRRLLAGVAGLLSLRVAFGAIAFFVTVLLARTLGRSGVGAYNYALAWVTLLGAPVILGLDQLLVREIPAYRLANEWGLVRGIVRFANRLITLLSALVILAAVGVSWYRRGSIDSDTLHTLWLALILIPLIALTRARQSTLQALHRVVVGAVPERLILPALLLVSLLAVQLVHVRVTAPAVMVINVVASAIAFATGAWMLHRQFPAEAKRVEPAYRARDWMRETVPIFLLSSVSVVFSQADILILGLLSGPAFVGPYSVADKAADLLTIVLVAQNSAFASTVSSLTASGEWERLQRLTTRIARLTLLGTLPAAIVCIGFAHWFLSFFYGAEFAVATDALILLGLGQLVNVTTGLNGMMLVMTGHSRSAMVAMTASSVVNVGLCFLMIPRWGMTGAATANMISLIVWNLLATVALQRQTGIHSTVFGAWGRARHGPAESSPA